MNWSSFIIRGKIAIVFFTISLNLHAQILSGHVYSIENGAKHPLAGANVFFPNSSNGVITDNNGAFAIERKTEHENYLVASFLGYSSDSVQVKNAQENVEFILTQGLELAQVIVNADSKGIIMSRLSTNKTELITKTGLTKMACCNLSESFENSATVTVGFTDAISGAKQVQLLGLSGIYTQLLTENVPTHRGLLSTFGWSYIPGSWLESIQISKGASSVVNGYESVSGQINLEMKKPNYTEPLFINVYADHLGRYETNITSAVKVAKDLWTSLLLHGSTDANVHDYNKDSFFDMPKTQFVNLYNRWFYLSETGIQSRTGLKFLYDSRKGGQDEAHHGEETEHNNHDDIYKTNIRNKNIGIENKTGFTVGDKEGQSIGIINTFNFSEENLDYGNKNYGNKLYKGLQNSFYSNVLFNSSFGDSHHYTAGASFTYDDYKTAFSDNLPYNAIPHTVLNRREIIPGIFGEYTYSWKEKFTFIIGLREDYNSHYGWLFTPRANIRYNVMEELVLRASVGRGYRSPNVIADNIGLMASSRKFNLDEVNNLDIERAWNYGGNISAYIPVWNKKTLTISLDYFYTQFQNQAVIDIERDRNSVFFYNLHGTSYANAWQADVSLSPFKGFDVFTAFRYNDTKITYTDGGVDYEMEKPLTSRYRGLVNLAYATNLRRWVFDFTAQINGPSRIPGLNGYLSEKRESETFPVYFAQITKNTKRFDFYAGSENIFDFKQKNPILNPDQPFSKDFDSSLVWGPVIGRKIYAGIRIRIGKLP